MKDITRRVLTQEQVREAGKFRPDQLVFDGKVIGHVECTGPVITDRAFCATFRPNRQGQFERRIWQLEPHELPDT